MIAQTATAAWLVGHGKEEGSSARRGDSHTGSQADVVQGKLSDSWVELQEQGQRLANATSGTEDGDLGQLQMVPY